MTADHPDAAPVLDPLEAFVDALPKVELHVHLEGAVRPETLLQLARRHGSTALPDDLDGLRDFYRFRDFGHFVEVYYAICDSLREVDDFALIARELGEHLAAQGVRYAEVTVTPFNHTRRGVAAEAVFEGIERGRLEAEASTGIRLRWVTDVPGEFGADAAVQTARLVLAHRPEGVIGFGLGGPEVGVPRAQFAEAFAMARDAGLHSLPHAGETTGPQTIWDALEHLGAERIGHGVRCLEDPALVEHLRERRIPLEVCPTSNVCLSVVESLEAHPLRRLLDAGLVVTLNSDDPPMFGTSLREECLRAARVLGLSPAELADLARAGIASSFLPDADRAALLAQVDGVPVPGTASTG
jgi:aminodeoxyfutalosine deaminase